MLQRLLFPTHSNNTCGPTAQRAGVRCCGQTENTLAAIYAQWSMPRLGIRCLRKTRPTTHRQGLQTAAFWESRCLYPTLATTTTTTHTHIICTLCSKSEFRASPLFLQKLDTSTKVTRKGAVCTLHAPLGSLRSVKGEIIGGVLTTESLFGIVCQQTQKKKKKDIHENQSRRDARHDARRSSASSINWQTTLGTGVGTDNTRAKHTRTMSSKFMLRARSGVNLVEDISDMFSMLCLHVTTAMTTSTRHVSRRKKLDQKGFLLTRAKTGRGR